jgi:hypothetical protein
VHVTRADVAEMMLPGEIEYFVPDVSFLGDYGMVSMEDLPGYFVDFSLIQERAGMVIFQKMRQYTFFYGDKVVSVQCSAGALESNHEAADESFELLKPLCAQVFNSVVIPGKYRRRSIDGVSSEPAPVI